MNSIIRVGIGVAVEIGKPKIPAVPNLIPIPTPIGLAPAVLWLVSSKGRRALMIFNYPLKTAVC
jgi:hypothetical protein